MKRVISCVLSLCIALSVFACGGVTVQSSNKDLNASTYAETAKIADDKIITENDNFRLIFNTENFLLEIEDKSNGFIWSSNFTDNSGDTVAAGIVKTDMLSHIVVSYAYGSDIKTANSRAGSVLRNAATFKAIKGGVRIE